MKNFRLPLPEQTYMTVQETREEFGIFATHFWSKGPKPVNPVLSQSCFMTTVPTYQPASAGFLFLAVTKPAH